MFHFLLNVDLVYPEVQTLLSTCFCFFHVVFLSNFSLNVTVINVKPHCTHDPIALATNRSPLSSPPLPPHSETKRKQQLHRG